MTMLVSYLIVPQDGTAPIKLADRAAFDAWCAEHGLTHTGSKRTVRIPLRAEIEGQPFVRSCVGPMYQGPGVVRYEWHNVPKVA
jgi:hypothetical protein